jgi:hypothetical protein
MKNLLMSGWGSGEGTVAFLVQGEKRELEKSWKIIQSMKDHPQLEEKRSDCKTCPIPGDPFGWGYDAQQEPPREEKIKRLPQP